MKREARSRVSTAPKAKPSRAGTKASIPSQYEWYDSTGSQANTWRIPSRYKWHDSTAIQQAGGRCRAGTTRQIDRQTRAGTNGVSVHIFEGNTPTAPPTGGLTWLGFRRRTDTSPRLSLHQEPCVNTIFYATLMDTQRQWLI
jgi:hypothetical protein